MESSSVVMMIIGIIIIWGGLAASIAHAVRKAKSRS
ncbi:MAG: methionine/alanine import family NSS transporter small subunit [Peptococcaceae bacterium]|nr:methionine/alanine import family NSS transporter small subunit [Peptococcaceae bacterium]